MEPHEGSLCLSTFNCRSVKSSVPEVSQLCAKCDILLLQEHWRLPNELDFLNNIHPDFLAFGQSSVDISDIVLIGRPYGGTAILYKKSFSSCVTRLYSSDPRVTAISLRLQTKIGPVLIVCVYMPTDDGTADCIEEFIATCANVSALYAESNAVHLVVAGDFNCQPTSRFYQTFTSFNDDNKLLFTDTSRLCNAFTYCNDAASHFSWIDHVLCTRGLNSFVSSCDVLYEFITSDHKPLFVGFDNIMHMEQSLPPAVQMVKHRTVADWGHVDDVNIMHYQSELDVSLMSLNVPYV